MKKITTTSALVLFVFSSFAQNNYVKEILVRHDTTTLKAEECEWVIQPLSKTGEPGKSVPLVILQAIHKGKLRAVDPLTDKQIPQKEIFTWRMAADTVAEIDVEGNMKYKTMQAKHNPDDIPLIRIYQDWYFDVSTGKLRSVIKWIELIEEVRSVSGYSYRSPATLQDLLLKHFIKRLNDCIFTRSAASPSAFYTPHHLFRSGHCDGPAQ